MAAKSKKKTDMALPVLPVSELEAEVERLSRELDAIIHSDIKARIVSHTLRRRVPGRYKDVLLVGPEFFEPLTEHELKEFVPE